MTISKLSEEDPTHQCTGFQHQFNVLDQICPSPTDVNSFTALKYPDKNRGNKYLPGKKTTTFFEYIFVFLKRPVIEIIVSLLLVESSRVILKGEQPDYIYAVFVDVRKLWLLNYMLYVNIGHSRATSIRRPTSLLRIL